eukprot:359132-Chlamydomonas_euryale.AAC.1
MERERWQAAESMSDMASNLVLFEREKRELARVRGVLAEQRRELDEARVAIEAARRRQCELEAHAALAPDELAGLMSQVWGCVGGQWSVGGV